MMLLTEIELLLRSRLNRDREKHTNHDMVRTIMLICRIGPTSFYFITYDVGLAMGFVKKLISYG